MERSGAATIVIVDGEEPLDASMPKTESVWKLSYMNRQLRDWLATGGFRGRH